MTWKTLEEQQPELAAFGLERLNGQVAYLATIRKDGSPRVHPMTPIIGQGHFFVFMEPTSPKGQDLQRDGRYAIHCAVSDNSGASGEFSITGRAHLIDNAELRTLAVSWPAMRSSIVTSCSSSTSRVLFPRSIPMIDPFVTFGRETCSAARHRVKHKTSKVFFHRQAGPDHRSDR